MDTQIENDPEEDENGDEIGRQPTADGLHLALGPAVRRRRSSKKWTQEQLARKLTDLGCLTMSKNAVSAIESGRRRIDLNELMFLTEMFEVTAQALFAEAAEYAAGVKYGEGVIFLSKAQHSLFGAPRKPGGPTYDDIAHLDEYVVAIIEDRVPGMVRDVVELRLRQMFDPHGNQARVATTALELEIAGLEDKLDRIVQLRSPIGGHDSVTAIERRIDAMRQQLEALTSSKGSFEAKSTRHPDPLSGPHHTTDEENR